MNRPSRLKALFVATAALVFAAGCMFTPSPTKKSVKDEDVVGTWRYQLNPELMRGQMTNDGIAAIEFKADGTFNQTLALNSQTNALRHIGKWKLDGPWLQLDKALMHDSSTVSGGYVLEGASWYMVDTTRNSRRLAIFGSEFQDPDSGYEFEKIR
jgi:hypothetical protein